MWGSYESSLKVLSALAVLVLWVACPAAFAQQSCEAGAFREVVASASASITQLHEKNGKLFQDNLQKLRTLNNWSEADYVAKATPFVKDETTVALDAANQALLGKVQSLEAGNAGTDSGRCAMLSELKLSMEQVVANTAAKWEHMLSKLAQASAQPLQAGFTQQANGL
jgi:hypothetical protein